MAKSLPPRSLNLMLELLNRPLKREEADKVAPASNSPHYIRELRSILGVEIPCQRIANITADGERGWYGVYFATPGDKQLMREYLRTIEPANDT